MALASTATLSPTGTISRQPLGPSPKVLLVEPLMHVHTPVHLLAALKSTGFENAQFMLVTATRRDIDRQRLQKIVEAHPNFSLHLLDHGHPGTGGRLTTLRATHTTMKAAEDLLQRERFDLVAYMLVDNILPFLAHPLSSILYPGHRAAAGNISGLVFRDNGLPPVSNHCFKERLKSGIDRWILGRAAAGGWFRKLAFFNHHNIPIAHRFIDPAICAYGVDPIDLHAVDGAKARQRMKIASEEKVILLFGSISGRKAVVETLDLFTEAPALHAKGVTLLIGGPIEPTIRSEVEAAVERARTKFRVLFHPGFVADEALPDYFACADLVVCAYKNFTASSGTLLHAAAFGKPAIVSENGVMHDAVKRYGFGESVRFDQPADFAQKTAALLFASPEDAKRYHKGAIDYASSMDARKYMAQFL